MYKLFLRLFFFHAILLSPMLVTLAHGQNQSNDLTVVWVSQLGSTEYDEANSIAIVDANTIYVTGDTNFSVAGGQEAWIGRIDGNGDDQCTKIFGSSGLDGSRGIAVDSNGNIYMVGFSPRTNNTAGWLAKYDSNCSEVWTRTVDSGSGDGAIDVAVDSSNNIYVGGWTRGDLFGQNAGGTDAWLARYDIDGNQAWIRQYGTAEDDRTHSLAIDSKDDVIVVGQTDGSGNDDDQHAWVAKYRDDGTQSWTRAFGTAGQDVGQGVAVDSADNIYVTGNTDGNFEGGASTGQDGFVAKYNSDGSQQWVRQIGSTSFDEAFDIAINSNDEIYITGYTGGALGDNNFTGGIDAWVAKYDSSGGRQWVHQLGTSDIDESYSIAIDENNAIYLGGHTNGDWGVAQQAGNGDAFVVKLLDSAAPTTQLVIQAEGPGVSVNNVPVPQGNTLPVNPGDKGELDGNDSKATLISQTDCVEEQIVTILLAWSVGSVSDDAKIKYGNVWDHVIDKIDVVSAFCDKSIPTAADSFTTLEAATTDIQLNLTLLDGTTRTTVEYEGMAINIETATATVRTEGTSVFDIGYDSDTGDMTVTSYTGSIMIEPTNPALSPFTIGVGEQVELDMNSIDPIVQVLTHHIYIPIVTR